MDQFIKKIIKGNSILPPSVCMDSLKSNFDNAINIDWYKKDEYYEAIFYKENIEHIALFGNEGNLIEYRQYLPDEFLPETIKSMLKSYGEIMNFVRKNKGNTIEYEVIIKDSTNIRYMMVISELGNICEKTKL